MSTRINWKKIVIQQRRQSASTSGSGLNTRYLRHIVDVSRAFRPIILGLRGVRKYNRFRSDRRHAVGLQFRLAGVAGIACYADTSRGKFNSATKRYDFGPFGDPATTDGSG